jgi:hypothetical protein
MVNLPAIVCLPSSSYWHSSSLSRICRRELSEEGEKVEGGGGAGGGQRDAVTGVPPRRRSSDYHR